MIAFPRLSRLVDRGEKKPQEDTSERMQPSHSIVNCTKATKPGRGNKKETLQSSLAIELHHQTTARYQL